LREKGGRTVERRDISSKTKAIPKPEPEFPRKSWFSETRDG
jgi:hypothetical protein